MSCSGPAPCAQGRCTGRCTSATPRTSSLRERRSPLLRALLAGAGAGRSGRRPEPRTAVPGTRRPPPATRGHTHARTPGYPPFPRMPGRSRARRPPGVRPSGELPPADGLPEFMLVRECAAQIRVSPPAIHGLIKQGHIEAVRVGRDFRICTRSWLAYLHAPQPGPRPQPEPEGDGQRDHPPQTAGLSRPATARARGRGRPGSAAGRVPCSRMSGNGGAGFASGPSPRVTTAQMLLPGTAGRR